MKGMLWEFEGLKSENPAEKWREKIDCWHQIRGK